MELASLMQILDEAKDREPYRFYEPNKKQLQFHKSNKFIRFFAGGNSSGKTYGLVMEAVWACIGKNPYVYTPPPPVNVWIVSLDFNNSRDVVKELLEGLLPQGEILKYDRNEHTYYWKNGSKLSLKSSDSGEKKFRGSKTHLILFDEEPPEDVYNECYARAAKADGRIGFAVTPTRGINWLYTRIIEPWKDAVSESRDIDIDVIQASIYDNKDNISENTIKKYENIKDPTERTIRLTGEFLHYSGLVYKDYNPVIHDIDPFKIPKEYPIWCCVDPHDRSPFSVLWVAVDPQGRKIVFDEYKKEGKNIDFYCKEVIKKNRGRRVIWLGADPLAIEAKSLAAGITVRKALAKRGLFVKPANNSRAGRDIIREWLHTDDTKKEPDIYVFSNLKHFKKEIMNYAYDDWGTGKAADKHDKKETPRKKNDHLMDDLKYIANARPMWIDPTWEQEVRQVDTRYWGAGY